MRLAITQLHREASTDGLRHEAGGPHVRGQVGGVTNTMEGCFARRLRFHKCGPATLLLLLLLVVFRLSPPPSGSLPSGVPYLCPLLHVSPFPLISCCPTYAPSPTRVPSLLYVSPPPPASTRSIRSARSKLTMKTFGHKIPSRNEISSYLKYASLACWHSSNAKTVGNEESGEEFFPGAPENTFRKFLALLPEKRTEKNTLNY